jgi:hypothetical protein
MPDRSAVTRGGSRHRVDELRGDAQPAIGALDGPSRRPAPSAGRSADVHLLPERNADAGDEPAGRDAAEGIRELSARPSEVLLVA